MFLPGHESIIVVVTEPMQLKFVLTDVRVYAQAEQLRVELWEQPKLAKQSLPSSSASSQRGARQPNRLRTRNLGSWRPPACSGHLLRVDTRPSRTRWCDSSVLLYPRGCFAAYDLGSAAANRELHPAFIEVCQTGPVSWVAAQRSDE